MLKKFRQRFSNKGMAATTRGDADRLRDSRLWDAAAQLYKSYLDLRPQDAGIWVQLGHCQKEACLFDEADVSYRRAAMLTPDNADIWLQIGHLRKLQGRITEAVANYAKALTKDPSLMPARLELEQFGYGPSDFARLIAESDSHAAVERFVAFNQRISAQPGHSEEHLLELNAKIEALGCGLADHEERIDEVCARLDELEERIAAQSRQIECLRELLSADRESSGTSRLSLENVNAPREHEALASRNRVELYLDEQAETATRHNGPSGNQDDNYKCNNLSFYNSRAEEIYNQLFSVMPETSDHENM
jgi:tetratricopeptide (TPR) repeat protein